MIRAWLAPILAGSVRARRDDSESCLDDWLKYVQAAAARRDETGRQLSPEVALALGFKHAANRRRRHPQAREEARGHLAERAGAMLRTSDFWFTRLILIQALCLWRMPDRSRAEAASAPQPDFRAVVRQWGTGSANRPEHPFVTETRWLAIRALEIGQPERYLWIDEDGIVSRIGSRPADPAAPRKHNLWISPSAGWTALHPRGPATGGRRTGPASPGRAGSPDERERRLHRTRLPALPPCLAGDRSPLYAGRSVDDEHFQPGSNCAPGCLFELCPYPSKGEQHRHELSEAFLPAAAAPRRTLPTPLATRSMAGSRAG